MVAPDRSHPVALAAFSLLLASASAQAPRVTPGTHEATLEVDGRNREFLVHVPKSYSGEKPVPLVVFLHGRGGSAAQASRRYGMTGLADEHGFLVAYPDGVDRRSGWRPDYYQKIGRGRGSDLPFVTSLLDELEQSYRVDPRRIYAAGHSAGGIMSYAIAGGLSKRIAAIGVVAGSIGLRRDGQELTIRTPRDAVSVIAFHGQRDRIIPYDEVHGRNSAYRFFISAPDSAAFWAKHNKCEAQAERQELFDGSIVRADLEGRSRRIERSALHAGQRRPLVAVRAPRPEESPRPS